jgi:hypothetical protein
MSNLEQMQITFAARLNNRDWVAKRRAPMTYKGIAYTVIPTATLNIWQWQFRIGDEVKTGKTETRLELLAMRRAELRINRELSKFRRECEAA